MEVLKSILEPFFKVFCLPMADHLPEPLDERVDHGGVVGSLSGSPNSNHTRRFGERARFVLPTAPCNVRRQAVTFVPGDHSRRTCERLWRAIPKGYKKASCYSDFWDGASF